MTDAPWWKFFNSDWRGSRTVRSLSRQEVGCFIDVLVLLYDGDGYAVHPDGSPMTLPDIAEEIARRDETVADVLACLARLVAKGSLVHGDDGRWQNPKAVDVCIARGEKSEKARKSIAARWGKSSPESAPADTKPIRSGYERIANVSQTYPKNGYETDTTQRPETRDQKEDTTTTAGVSEREEGQEGEGKPDPTEAYAAVLAEFGLPDTSHVMELLLAYAVGSKDLQERRDGVGRLVFRVAAPWVKRNAAKLIAGECGHRYDFREYLRRLEAEKVMETEEAKQDVTFWAGREPEREKATLAMLERRKAEAARIGELAAGMDGARDAAEAVRLDDRGESDYSESEVRA